jgi:Lysyl oxidase
MRTIGRTTRRGATLILALSLVGPLQLEFPTANGATGPPSLRLRAARTHLTLPRRRHAPIVLDPGIYVAAVGGTFALDVERPDYGQPYSVRQVWNDQAGNHERPLPSSVVHGWKGLAQFLHVVVRNASGKVVLDRTLTFCPNSLTPQRISTYGPADPTFPFGCDIGFNPFPRSSVWGIDRGWAVDPAATGFSFFQPTRPPLVFRGPDGNYTVTASITPAMVSLFGIDPDRATSTVHVTVTTQQGECPPICAAGSRAPSTQPALPSSVPTGAPPDPANLPDLQALPAFGVYVFHRNGQDYLSFGTTEWVGGGSDLDVEGFRRNNSRVMDAYQYFFQDDQVVGRAPVGTMVFDDQHGHHHWHFAQFARYSLLAVKSALVVRSHKQSFCIAPTDPVDLVLPGATLRENPFALFFLQCGTPTSLWVREEMPVGWGDTYLQNVAGQAFNITSVPNGAYDIRVEVNPLHLLYEQDTTNDTSMRRIVLGGRPGHRRVCMPALFGIDQEGSCA